VYLNSIEGGPYGQPGGGNHLMGRQDNSAIVQVDLDFRLLMLFVLKTCK
jgi:hypothetical protein